MDRKLPRLSLTDILAVVFVAAVACGGIFVGGWIAWFGITVCAIAVVAQLIAFVVGRGQTRARSIGFLIPVILYSLTLALIGSTEFSEHSGLLPHTRFVQTMIGDEVQRLRESETNQYDVQRKTQRSVQTKLPLVHLLVAVGLGFAGSRYAGHVYNQSRDGAN